jgi:Tfp pilus assembly protein PilX
MNENLALAMRRSSRRRREAGAALFVVSMTLAVLASVGLFALAAASTEVRTSGNERQATQTHYLADYGVVAMAHEVVGSKAQGFIGLMLTQATADSTCVSLPLPSTVDANDTLTRACRRVESTEIASLGGWSQPVTTAYTGTTPQAAGATPGSFGPTLTKGGFFVELTNPQQMTAPPRYALNLNLCFVQFTATAGGVTQPVFGGTTTPVYDREGTEMQRARFIAGPVTCPK